MEKNRREQRLIFRSRYAVILLLILIASSATVFAEKSTKIFIGDMEVKFKESSYIDVNGVLWTEVSSLPPKLGGKYFWNQSLRKFSIIDKYGHTNSYFIGKKKVYYGPDQSSNIDFAPVLKNGQVMMPLAYVLHLLGQAYTADPDNRAVYIFDMEHLVMKALEDKGIIEDEFYYISDWLYSASDPDLIYYELRQNVPAGQIAFLTGRYHYRLSTGELYKLYDEANKKELVGRYPVNSKTAKIYKNSELVKFEMDTEELTDSSALIFYIIEMGQRESIMKQEIRTSQMSPEQRGEVMYGLIMGDYGVNKTGLIISGNLTDEGAFPIDLKKTNELSELLLGGPADMSSKLYPYMTKNKNNYMIAASGGTIAFPRLKYKKVSRDRLTLIGSLTIPDFDNENAPRIEIAKFTAELQKNKKSPIDGYIVKSVDYEYFNNKINGIISEYRSRK